MIVHATRSVAAIDEMDAGLDLLRVAWMALHANELLTEDMIEAVANTLNDGINKLDLAREELNVIHGAN